MGKQNPRTSPAKPDRPDRPDRLLIGDWKVSKERETSSQFLHDCLTCAKAASTAAGRLFRGSPRVQGQDASDVFPPFPGCRIQISEEDFGESDSNAFDVIFFTFSF